MANCTSRMRPYGTTHFMHATPQPRVTKKEAKLQVWTIAERGHCAAQDNPLSTRLNERTTFHRWHRKLWCRDIPIQRDFCFAPDQDELAYPGPHMVPGIKGQSYGRDSLPLNNLVSDSANPHYVSDPVPQSFVGSFVELNSLSEGNLGMMAWLVYLHSGCETGPVRMHYQ